MGLSNSTALSSTGGLWSGVSGLWSGASGLVTGGGGGVPNITSSDGESASLTDNGDGTFGVVIGGTTVGTITQAQINAGGFITVVEPVVGMSGNNVVLTTTGYVIHVGSTPIETDVEVLADGATVGTALPFDATAYPDDLLQVRFSYSVGGTPFVILTTARAAPWTPANLPTLPWAWHDFSDGATVTLNGSNISAISNKGTATTIALAQGVATAQPALLSAALNGRNVADFDGTSDTLADSDAGWFTNGAMTHAAVYKPATLATGGARHVIANGGSSGAQSLKLLEVAGANFGQTRLAGSNLTAGQWNIAVADVAGTGVTTQRHWGNDNSPSSGPVTNNSTAFRYNFASLNGTTEFTDVEIAETMTIPAQLSEENRQRLEGYFAHKWGLTANLPSAHPYKTNPPMVGV